MIPWRLGCRSQCTKYPHTLFDPLCGLEAFKIILCLYEHGLLLDKAEWIDIHADSGPYGIEHEKAKTFDNVNPSLQDMMPYPFDLSMISIIVSRKIQVMFETHS